MREHRAVEALTVAECFELIGREDIGRLAVDIIGEPPLVVPVTFVVDGTTLIFRSDPGVKMTALGRPASFQVDRVDPLHRTGWSVLLQGTISIPGDDEVRHLVLDPWIGPRAMWVRLVPDVVTGRRLVLHLPELDDRGYR